MAEIALVAGFSAACAGGKSSSHSTSWQEQSLICLVGAVAGLGITGLDNVDLVDSMLVYQFSDGDLNEDETEKFHSRLRNDSRFRQIALAWQNDFETISRTPSGAQTAGRRAKRMEMALRRNPARSVPGRLPERQGAGSGRQLRGQQGRDTQKSQKRRDPQDQSSARSQILPSRGHAKVD